MNELICFIICCFVVSSIKLAWFESSLPIHVYHILHKLTKWNLGIPNWDNFKEHETTWEEWADTISLGKYPLIATLLTCPVCLSFHISFWVSLLIFLIAYITSTAALAWWFIPVCTLTVPYIVNKILK